MSETRFGFYYVPRSPFNPHGTYAIVAVEDLAVGPASRRHLAEVSGFGDGSPSARKVPSTVHLFCAAPDLLAAAEKQEEADRLLDAGDDVFAMLAYADAKELRRAAIAKATGA